MRTNGAAFTEEGLTLALTHGILEEGDRALVHSSLRSLGRVEGGAAAVVRALTAAVGESGTVVFPTLTGNRTDSPGCPPAFDASWTTCWTGAIPEAARAHPRAVRSHHPTHSVTAIGADAQWIASGHELCETPCGFGSPYDKIATLGGKILMIGVGLEVNTSIHMAEEMAGAPFVCQKAICHTAITRGDGSMFAWRGKLHDWGTARNYPSLEGLLYSRCALRGAQLGPAACLVADADLQRRLLVNLLLKSPFAVCSLQSAER